MKAKKGTIFHRIKNMTTTKNSEEPIINEAELVDFLKQCVVANDKPKLKSKLGETMTLRRKLLRENNEEFGDFMAFYFADPELVRVHFNTLICTSVFLPVFHLFFFLTYRYCLTLGCFSPPSIRKHCIRCGTNC